MKQYLDLVANVIKNGTLQASRTGVRLLEMAWRSMAKALRWARASKSWAKSSMLAEAKAEVRGVGRPTQVWHLTAAGHARFPDTHSELTVQLLQTVRETFGEDAIERLIDVRERQTQALYEREMQGVVGLKARVERLAQLRSREGYMAQCSEQPDGALILVENHCPICAAATACQGFCRAELQVFEQVLQAKVERVEHIQLGARRCAYRIAQR